MMMQVRLKALENSQHQIKEIKKASSPKLRSEGDLQYSMQTYSYDTWKLNGFQTNYTYTNKAMVSNEP